MAYQVLARKWRPMQFDQVVGQQHVLEPLFHALEQQRLHHAYLFTGTRGVGKTTIARILAKALNCEQGVGARPCGECQSCQEIEQGRFVDLIEVDAASRTKVEDTRELLDNVQYRPTRGRYKVYLIDEVHMLSRHSFNALLKTLEEPPEHVKFLLATTDPQKLPITVVSRCLQFNLRALDREQIVGQLDYVLEQERVAHDTQALALLAQSAKGSMRDALSLTDQAIAQGQGEVKTESVQRMLGHLADAHVHPLLDALANADNGSVFQKFDELKALVPDPLMILNELQRVIHRLALIQQIPAMMASEEQTQITKGLLRKLPAEVLQLYYRIIVEGKKEAPYAVDPQSAVEMTLLRLLSFTFAGPGTEDQTIEQPPESNLGAMASEEVFDADTDDNSPELESHTYEEADEHVGDASELIAQQQDIEAQAEQQRAPATSDEGLTSLLNMRQDLSASQASEKKNSEIDVETSVDQPHLTTKQVTSDAAELTHSAPVNLAQIQQQFNSSTRCAADVDNWAALVDATDVQGLTRQLLLNSVLEKVGHQQWCIWVTEEQQSLLNEKTMTLAREALSDVLSAQGEYHFKIGSQQMTTPLLIQQAIDQYRLEQAKQWLQGDVGFNQLLDTFEAVADETSISAR
ncbi:DNA polymerase III, subunit gamma and tau [Idiomarina sp. MD25a]|uniref:DNA polymerase III subunit gamma/tau n=1 Tax=Idiomarina sp. MD25a TaxID=1889913 RepID=UPI0008F84A55|nr:DNA polymerase III subunit gamma/tau [Idiomarina sp. MD25a]OIN01681.1 DNA polymerase III, subunit gamma and tau [Idiomarina sp. MD25a]